MMLKRKISHTSFLHLKLVGACFLWRVMGWETGVFPGGVTDTHSKGLPPPSLHRALGRPRLSLEAKGKSIDLVGKRGCHVKVRGQLEGVSSLRSLCGSLGLNSGRQAWQRGAFTHEPSLLTGVKMFRSTNYRPVVLSLDDHRFHIV